MWQRLAAPWIRREPGLTKQPSIPFVGHRLAARRLVRANEASARADPFPRHRSGGVVSLARAVSTVWADATTRRPPALIPFRATGPAVWSVSPAPCPPCGRTLAVHREHRVHRAIVVAVP